MNEDLITDNSADVFVSLCETKLKCRVVWMKFKLQVVWERAREREKELITKFRNKEIRSS